MSAAETITAAIEKLEQLRGTDMWTVAGKTDVVANGCTQVADVWEEADAALIVALHRTIDAQLAVLRDAANWQDLYAKGLIPDAGDNLGLNLATALIGEAS